MITKKLPGIALLAMLSLLAGCQSLEGQRKNNTYYSPASAYSIDLDITTFRGEVTLDERCTRYGGSTTFWDGSGRMFRIDYQILGNNPMIDIPRFASDLTVLTTTLNAYLRKIVAHADMVTSAEAAHRQFLRGTQPPSLFAIISIHVNSKGMPDKPLVQGTYYYGFLLFTKGQKVYVIQHRQPVLAPEKMKSVLLRLAEAMEIPGKKRDSTDLERIRRMLVRLAPGESPRETPVRLCRPKSL